MAVHNYLFVKPACLNIQGRLLVLPNEELRIERPVRTLLDAILAGLGRLDILARLASRKRPRAWAKELLESLRASPLLGAHALAGDSWRPGATLLCDWDGALCKPRSSVLRAVCWTKPDKKKLRAGVGRPQLSFSNESFFVQAQVMRGVLGTSRSRVVVLGSTVDRVCFGDLVFRHRCIAIIDPTWPESRRVWQADPKALHDTDEWLESLFYALRHTREEDGMVITTRSGTAVAGQDVRCLVDSKIVICWTEAQQRELIRFYGRSSKNTWRVPHRQGEPISAIDQRRLATRALQRAIQTA